MEYLLCLEGKPKACYLAPPFSYHAGICLTPSEPGLQLSTEIASLYVVPRSSHC